jgi:hypothetical protein
LTDPLNVLPDPAFERMKPALREHLARTVADIHAAQFAALLDPLIREVVQQGFAQAGAHEGTVWLVNEANENLEPAYNTGAQAAQIIGAFKQPLNSGLVCMVFASEQPFLENEVFKNAQQSKALDSLLQTETFAMIAVPFYLLGECRGVVSCVQLKRPDATEAPPPGFRPENLVRVQRMTAVFSQLVEHRILCRTTGLTFE